MQKVDIYSDEWCDIVFETRPKDYGAYIMRKLSSKRHRLAIILTLALFILAFTLPGLIKSMIPDRKEANVEVNALSNIKMEKKAKEPEKIKLDEPPPQKIKSTIQFTPPVIKNDDEVKDDQVMKNQDELNKSKLDISTIDVKGNSNDADAQDLADLNATKKEVVEEVYEKPFTVVEQMPEFPGGEQSMMKFLRENIKYPQMARESGIAGSVYVTFVVNKSGQISDVRILRGIGGGCDEEALRVVRAMPSWIPGRQNGKSVPVQFNLPIKFTLQ
ncbi:MAG: energy transducer TonB [Bacteroidetes bacterium]|nr:energy transducer TonB [Bacteroidota bacterium]